VNSELSLTELALLGNLNDAETIDGLCDTLNSLKTWGLIKYVDMKSIQNFSEGDSESAFVARKMNAVSYSDDAILLEDPQGEFFVLMMDD
jgi:hypothetical protein